MIIKTAQAEWGKEMITKRVNKWECDTLTEAVAKTEMFLAAGLKAWRVHCMVYWVEESTD